MNIEGNTDQVVKKLNKMYSENNSDITVCVQMPPDHNAQPHFVGFTDNEHFCIKLCIHMTS